MWSLQEVGRERWRDGTNQEEYAKVDQLRAGRPELCVKEQGEDAYQMKTKTEGGLEWDEAELNEASRRALKAQNSSLHDVTSWRFCTIKQYMSSNS